MALPAKQCDRIVMVVEDDRDVRETIAEILEDNAYHPVLASNGEEALHRLRSATAKPCVILLDIMMPVMNGWEFRALQRSEQSLSGIPVVVITAHADASRAAAEMDAAGFLRKPVKLESLLASVSHFCTTSAPPHSDPLSPPREDGQG
jgi:CheY-like chemotaxis protein